MLFRSLSLDGLHTPRLREHVRRAIEYRSALRRAMLERNPDSGDLVSVEDAAVLVHRLCTSIQRYESDRLLAEDHRRLQQIEHPTPGQLRQLNTLNELARQMESAEQEAVDLLATLGESYASLQHLRAVPDAEGSAPEVLSRMRGGANKLRDSVQALEELYRETRPAASEAR